MEHLKTPQRFKLASLRPANARSLALRKEIAHHTPSLHTVQTNPAPARNNGQIFMIQPEEVENGGVQIAEMHLSLNTLSTRIILANKHIE